MGELLRFFINLFPAPPTKAKMEQRKGHQLNSLIRRFSRGNIRLQFGKYLTEKNAKDLKQAVIRYHF